MLRSLLALLAITTLMLKLGTAELHYRDDPTTGVIVSIPAPLDNRVLRSPGDPRPIYLAGPDESYLGAGLYRFVVTIGWLACLLTWGLLEALRWSQGRRSVTPPPPEP